MMLVLHPEQVQAVLEMAAETGLDPEVVAQEMYGSSQTRKAS